MTQQLSRKYLLQGLVLAPVANAGTSLLVALLSVYIAPANSTLASYLSIPLMFSLFAVSVYFIVPGAVNFLLNKKFAFGALLLFISPLISVLLAAVSAVALYQPDLPLNFSEFFRSYLAFFALPALIALVSFFIGIKKLNSK